MFGERHFGWYFRATVSEFPNSLVKIRRSLPVLTIGEISFVPQYFFQAKHDFPPFFTLFFFTTAATPHASRLVLLFAHNINELFNFD
jgi:hypothetical protein